MIANLSRLPSVKDHQKACAELHDSLTSVINLFIELHPNMTSVTVLGILRLVEHNFIARI